MLARVRYLKNELKLHCHGCCLFSDSANTLALDATSRKIHVGEDVGVVEPFNILGYR